jgi:hypothetical protein
LGKCRKAEEINESIKVMEVDGVEGYMRKTDRMFKVRGRGDGWAYCRDSLYTNPNMAWKQTGAFGPINFFLAPRNTWLKRGEKPGNLDMGLNLQRKNTTGA